MPLFLREAEIGASHFWSTGGFRYKTADIIGLLGFKAHTKKLHAKIREALQFGDIGKFKTAGFWLKNGAVNSGIPRHFSREKSYISKSETLYKYIYVLV